MRDQYVGDISDLLKYGLLRALSGQDKSLGVAWYYIEGHDGRSDGHHREWIDEPAWRKMDEALFTGLSNLSSVSVEAVENSHFWPDRILFHRVPVPVGRARIVWAQRKLSALKGSDIVFFDPDNGLSEKPSLKHATFEELGHASRNGHALVTIKFPGRNATHEEQLIQLHQRIRQATGVTDIVTLRTSVAVPARNGSYVPRIRWFTITGSDATLKERLSNFSEAINKIPRVKSSLWSVS